MSRNFKKLSFATGPTLSQSWTVPENTRAIALQASGNVNEHGASDGATIYWPIGTGAKESVIARDEAGSILYFTGENGDFLYIRWTTGLGS